MIRTRPEMELDAHHHDQLWVAVVAQAYALSCGSDELEVRDVCQDALDVCLAFSYRTKAWFQPQFAQAHLFESHTLFLQLAPIFDLHPEHPPVLCPGRPVHGVVVLCPVVTWVGHTGHRRSGFER